MSRGNEIEAAFQKVVDSKELAGAATLIWHARSRCGEAQTACVGWRDVEAKLPVERDTIFRIASMTKPITSVTALMLVEEGRIALTDSITRYAPEFSQMRVLRSPNGPLDETDPAERPISFEDLLTQSRRIHLCGFPSRPHRPGISRCPWRRYR